MSPTGTPDFGAQPVTSSVSPTFDQGELANRLLYGFGNVTRSGRVFWATGFEDGLMSDFQGSCTPELAGIDKPSWQGSYSLLSRTTAVAGNESIFFKYFLASQSPGRWGFETMFCVQSWFTDIIFEMSDHVIAPSSTMRARIKIYVGDSSGNTVDVYYQAPGGGWNLITSLGRNFALGISNAGVYHNAKLVVDFQTRKIVRFFLDGTVYELNVNPYLDTASPEKKNSIILRHITTVNSISQARFDNVILTADEP